MMNAPLGPGIFIFFRRSVPDEDIGGGSNQITEQVTEEKTDRVKEDDEELLLFLQMIVTRRLI